MLHETDPASSAQLMRAFEKHTLDDQAHNITDACGGTGSCRTASYVKGWKIGPSHFLNQDLATIWLDK